ncbi:hypothetical protein [Planococcus sp. CAU13]|uniref:hypothetical protein n=1 Tax=Planococcus sp. CAU13 TaxID=1541197 RepID=UPI00052FF49F|nr:hypothetical protein [Planococcus sp. CAU13]
MAHNVEFQYKYIPDDTWASGYLCIGGNNFEFVCSYLFKNPLEELLNAVYQIVPDLASFSRKEIDFIMLEEPVEYRWEFKLIDEEKVTINIYEKGSDLNAMLIFNDNLYLNDLLRALVHCIGRDAELRSNEDIERIYKQFKVYLKSH